MFLLTLVKSLLSGKLALPSGLDSLPGEVRRTLGNSRLFNLLSVIGKGSCVGLTLLTLCNSLGISRFSSSVGIDSTWGGVLSTVTS